MLRPIDVWYSTKVVSERTATQPQLMISATSLLHYWELLNRKVRLLFFGEQLRH
jgi:hypothetical protein